MLFADYVYNLDPDENNTGYAFGFVFGAAKAKGTWQLGYTYEKLEADSVFGLLTDSDFGGAAPTPRDPFSAAPMPSMTTGTFDHVLPEQDRH